MSIKIYAEVSCDYCHKADYYSPPNVDDQATENGWVVGKKKHFCGDNCKEHFYRDNKSNK